MTRPALFFLALAAAAAAAVAVPGCAAPPPADEAGAVVLLVRHAEKAAGQGSDPPLTDAGERRAGRIAAALGAASLDAVYASEYVRTRETARRVAEAAGLGVTVVPAADVEGLAARIEDEHRGGTVLVVGHSNTLPEIMRALGVAEPPLVAEDEHDDLFVVMTDPPGPPRLLSLRLEAGAPAREGAP